MLFESSSSPAPATVGAPRPLASFPPPAAITLFLERVRAGFPSPAADYVDEPLDLNAYLVTHQAASFFFRVAGESMVDAGILPGDNVLVDRSIDAAHGDIVLAVLNDEYTLKKLYRRGGRIELCAENKAFPAIPIKDGDTLSIWGVVVGVVRKMRP